MLDGASEAHLDSTIIVNIDLSGMMLSSWCEHWFCNIVCGSITPGCMIVLWFGVSVDPEHFALWNPHPD